MSNPNYILFSFAEEDVQSEADDMGFNPLSINRLNEVKNSFCLSDLAIDEIRRCIRDAINSVMGGE